MKVRNLMTKEATFCGLDTDLSTAAGLMAARGCGFLPVVGEGGNVIGAITDRDISIALGARNRKPCDLRIKDVMAPKLFTCTADDSIHCALKTMRCARIRRLPVVDLEGALIGVLSIDDVVLHAHEHALKKEISYEDVEETYKAICGHASPLAKRDRVAA